MQEITLQFWSPFKLCSWGRDSGHFLWKNIGPGWEEFGNVLVQLPGGSLGSNPWMAADKCIIRDSFRTFPLHFLSLTDTSEHAIIQAAVFIEDAAQVISLKQLVNA